MCLAVLQLPGDKPLDRSVFDNSWQVNRDGAGYMFAVDGQLIIRKPFFKLKSLIKAYKKDFAEHGQTSPFAIHFRYATHGKVDAINTHPHPFKTSEGKEIALIHNGIITIETEKGLSDSIAFAKFLDGYSQTVLLSKSTTKSLSELIGSNKVIILTGSGEYTILNESQGHWGTPVRWYSNHGYLPYNYRSLTWDRLEEQEKEERLNYPLDEDADFYYSQQMRELEHEIAWDQWAEDNDILLDEYPAEDLREFQGESRETMIKYLSVAGYITQ
jgi:hypothetical protein